MNKTLDWIGNKNSIFKTLGASNHTEHERAERDFYATDSIAIDKLSKVYDIPKNILEPCAGNGDLSRRLKELGHNVESWDIVEREYPLEKVCNFFEQTEIPKGYSILTNPPYNMATEMVLHALNLVQDAQQVIMFLKIQFLEGKDRFNKIFKKYPPKYVFVSIERITCAMNGEFIKDGKKQSSAVCYAWFVWEKGYKGETTIKWI